LAVHSELLKDLPPAMLLLLQVLLLRLLELQLLQVLLLLLRLQVLLQQHQLRVPGETSAWKVGLCFYLCFCLSHGLKAGLVIEQWQLLLDPGAQALENHLPVQLLLVGHVLEVLLQD
jgi:hypothetical protein